jgi:hypothetical protein
MRTEGGGRRTDETQKTEDGGRRTDEIGTVFFLGPESSDWLARIDSR